MQQQYEPGRTVLGRYVIERLLGEGGMGAVYVARHAELSRKRFAVKTLRPDLFGYGAVEERFRREADVLASLDHPGIVSINDYGMDGQIPVMVMELLQGETLRDRLHREGPLPLPEVVRILRDVSNALDYTHGCNPPIVHRDLKPENLFLVQPDARVKVLDFGIAKVSGMGENLTQTSTALGTPQYMSPEQLRNSKSVDRTTDVFALASITYELLTNVPAFPGEGIAGVVLAMFEGDRPRPSQVRPDVPPSVDAVLACAWRVEPSQRFPSAGEFAQALAVAATGQMPALPEGNGRAAPPDSPTVGPRGRGQRAPAGATISARPPAPAAGVDPNWAVPETRPVGQLPSPAPAGVVPQSTLAPHEAAASSAQPRRASRMPIVLGALVAVLAVGAGVTYAMLREPSPAAPTVPTQPVPARATEPVLAPQRPMQTTEPTVPGNGRPGAMIPAAGPAPDPFDVVRNSVTEPVRQCTAGRVSARTLTLRVTWSGPVWIPMRIALGQRVPADVQTCISRALATYGQIPAQPGASVTRSLTIPLQ